MQPIDREKINEKLAAMPQEVRDVIFSPAFNQSFREACQAYKIHVDKIDELVWHLTGVFVGMMSTVGLLNFFKRELGLSPQDASDLYQKLLQKQIFPVQEAFRNAMDRQQALAEKERLEEMGEDTLSEPVIAQPTEAHKLTNTSLGVIEDEDLHTQEAERPIRTEPARTEAESVARAVSEKNTIIERKLSEMTTALPRAGGNVNIGVEMSEITPHTQIPADRTNYHGQDPYREPIDGNR